MLSPTPCPPLVSPLECPGGDRLSALTPTRGSGSCLCLWKDFCSVLLSPPSHLGYPLPSGFSIVQNVPLPSRLVLRSLQGQVRVLKLPGASSGSPTDPRDASWLDYPPPLSRRASYNLFVLILTFRTQDSPPGHCPTSRAPQCYQLCHYCTCPICAGERDCVCNKPLAHFLGLPQGWEPLANP